jgi:flavin-dependent dehydrogenase
MINKEEVKKYNFIIVGGGIAGTTCAERVCVAILTS